MVSSGKVSSDASSLSSLFSKYQSSISEMSSNWKGASYDNLSSKAQEFVSEYSSAIQDEMSAFASACELYEQYKEAKSSLESARSNYSQAVSSGNQSSASNYNSQISSYSSKVESLKTKINTYLQKASSKKLNSTATTSSVFTAASTTGSETTNTEAKSETPKTESTTSAISSSSTINNAINWAVGIANDNKYGYSQNTRWGNPNYDCSSLVISAYEKAGIKVKEAGASYTGNMKRAFQKAGFEWIPGDPKKTGLKLKPGDVLLKENNHTEMYVGNGKNVGAHSNYDGKNGDSSGNEISVRASNHAWDGVLRLKTT